MQIPESMRNWRRNSWINRTKEVLNLYITEHDSVYHLKKATLETKLCLFEHLRQNIQVIIQEFSSFLLLWTYSIEQNIYHQNGFSSGMYLNIRRNQKYLLGIEQKCATAAHLPKENSCNTQGIIQTILIHCVLNLKHVERRLCVYVCFFLIRDTVSF